MTEKATMPSQIGNFMDYLSEAKSKFRNDAKLEARANALTLVRLGIYLGTVLPEVIGQGDQYESGAYFYGCRLVADECVPLGAWQISPMQGAL